MLGLLIPATRLTAQSSPAGEIRGRVTITKKGDAGQSARQLHDRYSTHRSDPMGMSMVQTEGTSLRLSERAVLYLEGDGLSQGPLSPPAKNPTLDQKNLQFHPQVLPILAGTTVDFPNQDNLFHNVFSYSRPKEFDLGRYPKDDSRSVRFDRPGVVRVYCDIHSQMNATILVLPHPYFATPDDDGSFVIKGVPPGKYTLLFWYDRDVAERRNVEVRAGETIEINISN